MAYQGLDQYEDAMAAYADGLVADPKQGSMLHGLIEAMLKSSYRGKYGGTCCNDRPLLVNYDRKFWTKAGKI